MFSEPIRNLSSLPKPPSCNRSRLWFCLSIPPNLPDGADVASFFFMPVWTHSTISEILSMCAIFSIFCRSPINFILEIAQIFPLQVSIHLIQFIPAWYKPIVKTIEFQIANHLCCSIPFPWDLPEFLHNQLGISPATSNGWLRVTN